MIKILISTALFFLIIINSFCQKGFDTVQMTFIKNEAFVIKDSNSKILIDYDNSNTITNNSYYSSQPPFNNIDFISISHSHEDHYDLNLSGNYLDNNLNCRLILPNEVFETFKTYKNFDKVKDRVSILSLVRYKCVDKTIGNHNFKYILVPHAAGFSKMQNMIFVFTSGNIKFLHSGDYWGDDIDSIKCRLLDEKIDIAMIHFNFLSKPTIDKGIERIKKYINPKYIILMHIPQDSERMNEALKAKDALKDKYPNIYLFMDDFKTINITKTDGLIKID